MPLTEAQKQELARLKAEEGGTAADSPEASALGTAFGVAGKAADYQRGALASQAIIPFLEKLSGKDLQTPEEKTGALSMMSTQQAPSYGTILQRLAGEPDKGAGAGEAYQAAFQKMAPILGIGVDMALDPLTYETFGGGALARLAKGSPEIEATLSAIAKKLRPVSDMAESAGESIYKSPFGKMDAKALQAGKEIAPSQILFDAGKTGNAIEMADQADEIRKGLGAKYKQLDKIADDSGATVDLSNAFKKAEDEAKLARKNGFDPAADEAEQILTRLKAKASEGHVPFSQGRGFKSALDSEIYTASGLKKDKLSQILQTARQGVADHLDDLTKQVSNVAVKDTPAAKLASEYADTNARYGSLSKAQKIMEQKALTEAGLKNVTAVDAMVGGGGILGGGLMGHSEFGLLPLAAKKAYDLTKTTAARTKIGLLLNQLGKTGVLEPVAARALSGAGSPWTLIGDNNGQ